MKSMRFFAGLIFLGAAIFIFPSASFSHDVDFSLGINIGAPPPQYVYERPPALRPIPQTPAYYVPNVSAQLYFYSNNWYRLHNGYWYMAAFYNGPWMFLQPAYVPSVFIDLASVYYVSPPREYYRPYWKHRAYWRERERDERRHEYMRERDDRYDRHRDREYDARKDWKNWKKDRHDRDDHRRGFRS